MIKNVTVRNVSGEIVGTYENFPHTEHEQRDTLRQQFGPGRYKVSYNKGKGPQNKWVFVGAQGMNAKALAMPVSGSMSPSTERIDLTIYRELIVPLANNLTERLDRLENMLADVLTTDAPKPSGDETPPPPPPPAQPQDQASRIAEALQRLQNGEPLESLIGEYADLIPSEYSGMAPALLRMLNGMKGGNAAAYEAGET
jgi:hypothetical protein